MNRALSVVVVVVTVSTASLVGAAAAQAAAPPTCTITWVGPAHGAWEKATNWSPARVPRATDAACLGSGTPTVRVNASTTVHDVVVGAAELAVVAGATVTVTVGGQLTVTGGTLTGPGTILTGWPGASSCCTDTVTLTGPVRLIRRLRLVTAPGLTHISGTVAFSGGSALDNSGRVLLADGAVLTDEDADPRNAYRQSDASAFDASTSTDGQARIEVAATMTGSVVTDSADANLQLLRLTNESPEGVLSGLDFDGTVTIPYPVSSLRNTTVQTVGGHLIAASTGRPALPATLRTVTNSNFGVGRAFSAAGSLTFARSGLNDYAQLSAPAVVLTDATSVYLPSTGSIRVRQGAGTVTVRPDTANGPVRMRMYDAAAVFGSLDQRGGVLTTYAGRSNSPQITGDWTLAGAATFSAELGRFRGSPLPASLVVGGTAALAGSFVLVPDRNTPPVGTVTPVLTAAGGVSGTFSSATLAPGYALSSTATQVLVTYTG